MATRGLPGDGDLRGRRGAAGAGRPDRGPRGAGLGQDDPHPLPRRHLRRPQGRGPARHHRRPDPDPPAPPRLGQRQAGPDAGDPGSVRPRQGSRSRLPGRVLPAGPAGRSLPRPPRRHGRGLDRGRPGPRREGDRRARRRLPEEPVRGHLSAGGLRRRLAERLHRPPRAGLHRRGRGGLRAAVVTGGRDRLAGPQARGGHRVGRRRGGRRAAGRRPRASHPGEGPRAATRREPAPAHHRGARAPLPGRPARPPGRALRRVRAGAPELLGRRQGDRGADGVATEAPRAGGTGPRDARAEDDVAPSRRRGGDAPGGAPPGGRVARRGGAVPGRDPDAERPPRGARRERVWVLAPHLPGVPDGPRAPPAAGRGAGDPPRTPGRRVVEGGPAALCGPRPRREPAA